MTHSSSFIKKAIAPLLIHTLGKVPSAVEGFSIDTRSLKPGQVFIATQGENLDGHQFIEEAFQKGAIAAIVGPDYSVPPSLKSHAFWQVKNPLAAFHLLARSYLQTLPATRVALTGSNGKTTTKELIHCVLSACLGEDKVFSSSGNQNNHFGVPLSAFKVTPQHEVAVFEMGMNHFGEIAQLAQIVQPHVGLITNIGSAHGGNLGGPAGIAKAKAELFEALGKKDIALINADDPRCLKEAETKVKSQKIFFGKAPWSEVRLVATEPEKENLKITLSYKGATESVFLPLLGEHNAQNATAAVAVAMALNLDFSKAVQGLAQIKPVKGRLQKHFLRDHVLLLDDTYNANPESMEAGIHVLSSLKGDRRIAVLGQMGELGPNALAFHHHIGAACAQQKIDRLFACGELAKAYGEGAIENGLSPAHFVWAKDSEALAPLVAQVLDKGDIIWIKGSRVTQMEKVVEHLLKV